MVKQRKEEKPSTMLAQPERELAAARPGTFDALEASLRVGLPNLTASIERRLVKTREELLLELANSQGVRAPFRRQFHSETDAIFASAGQNLRVVWVSSTPMKKKQLIVNAWLVAGFNRPGKVGIAAPLSLGRLVLDPQSFPVQFVVAILENWRHFAMCRNPACVTPYFFARRRTQKVCAPGHC